MRKIFLLCISLIAFGIQANAQCTPNLPGLPTTKQYIVPDSATGLGPACPGKPYSETIYIKVFKDSTAQLSLFGTTVTAKFVIDSFIINLSPDSLGIPSALGLTIASVPAIQPANSKHNFPHLKVAPILGDSLACVKISGNIPANATPATYPLSIKFIGFADAYIPPSPIALINDTSIKINNTSYKLVVQPSTGCTLGIEDMMNGVQEVKAIPNPAYNNLSIGVSAQVSKTVQVQLLSLTGSVLATKEMRLSPGANYAQFDISGLAKGLYIYKLSDGTSSTSGKFTKE
jgi:hypothetical protein